MLILRLGNKETFNPLHFATIVYKKKKWRTAIDYNEIIPGRSSDDSKKKYC